MPTPEARKARQDATLIMMIVGAVTVAVAIFLVWQNAQSQTQYSNLKSGQTTGLAQRSDQLQLTCALWALLRDQGDTRLSSSTKLAADRICTTAPTPVPNPAPSAS
jgi:hypothetical protein